MTYQIGDKVKFGRDSQYGEVIQVLKNGKIKIAYWVHGGFSTKPELWKDTFRPESVEPA